MLYSVGHHKNKRTDICCENCREILTCLVVAANYRKGASYLMNGMCFENSLHFFCNCAVLSVIDGIL